MDIHEGFVKVGLFFIPFLFSLCFHEFAHGFVAKIRGDNTAEMMGRLTMNPMAHLDWIGTVGFPIAAILFGFPVFGWARPVPVNPRNLKNARNDMFWVALAGPLSNVLLFFLGFSVFYFLVRFTSFNLSPKSPEAQMLTIFLAINLYLAFFNMLPLHPLDGGKVFGRFLPHHWNRWLENHQYELNMALLFLILVGGLHYMALPVHYVIRYSMSLVIQGGLYEFIHSYSPI